MNDHTPVRALPAVSKLINQLHKIMATGVAEIHLTNDQYDSLLKTIDPTVRDHYKESMPYKGVTLRKLSKYDSRYYER